MIGIRKCAYPFDWIGHETDKYILYFRKVLALKNDDEIESFCADFFCGGEKMQANFDEFGIGFPHDDKESIREKYTRRIKRLHEHLKSATKVNLFFAVRWENMDDVIVEMLGLINQINPNLHLYAINSFKNGVPDEWKNIVTNYYIDYTEDMVPWIGKERDWKYDKSKYKYFLIDTYGELRDKALI